MREYSLTMVVSALLMAVLTIFPFSSAAAPLPMDGTEQTHNRWWTNAFDQALQYPHPINTDIWGGNHDLDLHQEYDTERLPPHATNTNLASGSSSGAIWGAHSNSAHDKDWTSQHGTWTGTNLYSTHDLNSGANSLSAGEQSWYQAHPLPQYIPAVPEWKYQPTNVILPSSTLMSIVSTRLGLAHEYVHSDEPSKSGPLQADAGQFHTSNNLGMTSEQDRQSSSTQYPRDQLPGRSTLSEDWQPVHTEELESSLRHLDAAQRRNGFSNPGIRLLQQHPSFTDWEQGPRLHELPYLVDMSPEAQRLKEIINSHLFKNALEWVEKGDHVVKTQWKEILLRRFVSRMQARELFATDVYLEDSGSSIDRVQIIAAPHKIFKAGSSLFDPEPDGLKRFHISFWTPSRDKRPFRLQFIGAAVMMQEDAFTVINPMVQQVHAPPPSTSESVPFIPPHLDTSFNTFSDAHAILDHFADSPLHTVPFS